jgi:phage tail-like protein
MALDGTPRVFATKFDFVVHIDDLTDSPVTTVSELGGSIGKVVVRGGGGDYHVQAGERDPKDITIERSLDLANLEFYNWWKDCEAKVDGYAKQISIDILKPDKTVAFVWNIENAFITEYSGYAGDAGATSDPAMEKIVIANTRQYIAPA